MKGSERHRESRQQPISWLHTLSPSSFSASGGRRDTSVFLRAPPSSAQLHPATSTSATSPEVCWTQPVTEVGLTKGPSPTDHFSPNELPTRPDPRPGAIISDCRGRCWVFSPSLECRVCDMIPLYRSLLSYQNSSSLCAKTQLVRAEL